MGGTASGIQTGAEPPYTKEGEILKKRADVIQYCMTFSGVFEDYPFHDPNWTCMRLKQNQKIFAWIYEREENIWVNVKAEPEWRDFWRNAYSSVIPAYHMNKTHWNSIILDGTIPQRDIQRMIAESYDLCSKGTGKTK